MAERDSAKRKLFQQFSTPTASVDVTRKAAKAKQHEKRPQSRIPLRSNTRSNQLVMVEHRAKRKLFQQFSTPTASVDVICTVTAKAKQHEKRPQSRIPLRSNTRSNQLVMVEHRARAIDETKQCRQLSTPTASVYVICTPVPRAAKAKQHEKRPQSRIPSSTNQLAMAEHVDRARASGERKRCRQLSTPTGITPKQQEKRPRSRRLPLTVKNSTSSVAQQSGASCTPSPTTASKWKLKEDIAIVKFILLSTPSNSWPAMSENFWKSAALFVHQRSQEPLRSSLACSSRVRKVLSKHYTAPREAEIALTATRSKHPSTTPLMTLPARVSSEPQALSVSYVDTGECQVNLVMVDKFQNFKRQVLNLPPADQLKLISELFCELATSFYKVAVDGNFLELTLLAMKHLDSNGKVNVLYHLAKGLGTLRPNSNESRFPVSRMPFGLLQYMTTFFTSTNATHAVCSEGYEKWLVSMYSLFGTKFSKMLCGPMWSQVSTTQTGQENVVFLDPIQARVNVPALGERTMRRHIVNTQFSNSWNIQMATLDHAVEVHPEAKWWIKADGCDIMSGLEESVRLEWNGDADYATEAVQELYHMYRTRRSAIDMLCTNQSIVDRRPALVTVVHEEYGKLEGDVNFVVEALKKCNDAYSAKVRSGVSHEKTLLNLAWNVDDLQKLSAGGRVLRTDLATLKDVLEDADADIIALNVAKKLTLVHKKLLEFVKGLYKHKRTAATHILVILLSTESRSKKPYALPIQCISYVGISVAQMRSILNKIVIAMKDRNMDVSGFLSNGEYNTMRVKGYTRPLSVLEIKSQAKKKFDKMSVTAMMNMLTPTEMPDGSIQAVKGNPAVPMRVLSEIWGWKNAGIDTDDWIGRLRLRTVPSGYTPCPWSDQRAEDKGDKLRAILSQMEYKYQVCHWVEKGVPFSTHMYVPEIHPITGKEFHEREDFAHIMKRVCQCTRKGGPQPIRVERFHEALYDDESGLTYPALTGQRKQSVQDAENLFSEGVELFMRKNKYEYEEKYVRVIRNWRRSCDERGLSSLQRSKYNYDLLNLILDELMPWHTAQYDFSLMEVTRKVTVLGFTREIVYALTTGIESVEWKRREYAQTGRPMENPRSSTTDDVECMFSIMRDLTGKHFTLRQARYTWRKVCIEFDKRSDPTLGFYYFSSSHDRFYEGSRPHFDEKPSKKRKKRVRRKEQPAHLMYGRATLPESGARSTRMTFHNLPIPMPPPLESTQHHLFEHSYAQ